FDQQEIRWHAAQMLPRLQVTAEEQERIVQVLLEYLKDSSRIVQVNALQALEDISLNNRKIEAMVKEVLESNANSESTAVRSRCVKLLTQLNR
ncbi:MAG TPA: hypothetical protein VKA68_09225, partial [bacterium]|nr:hypothetical protein [bacterium]